MRYLVMLGDGMADYPVPSLGDRTPLEAADKPMMDWLSKNGELGLVRTLYPGMPTGSDIANLSVLGYDPKKYYTGRSPIEALGLGIALTDEDTVFRLNLVSISTDGGFEDKTMLDHSSDKITNEEAYELLDALKKAFETPEIKLHPGVSYRHILIWKGIDYGYTMMPPHDILGKPIRDYLPGGPYGEQVLAMMKKSYDILMAHPVNQDRIQRGLKPANCMWLWGEGTKPGVDEFYGKYGVRGAVITAVPLIQGLAKGTGLRVITVEGATGDYYTNYAGKARAAVDALNEGEQFLFIHVEAPDECGHDADVELKVKSIERIDREILTPVKEKLDALGEPYRILVMPDHATPIALRTHAIDPVPYVIYTKGGEAQGSGLAYNEKTGAYTGRMVERGHDLMGTFIGAGR